LVKTTPEPPPVLPTTTPEPTGFQPRILRRLAAGPTPCEGDIEVFHKGRWQVLCDNREQQAKWGTQLCQELRCGNLSSSAEVRDPPSMGVTCAVPTLHLCPDNFVAPRTCSRTRVVFSFHRNSTVTLRPRVDGQQAQGGDNDYAQPPQKSSYLLAYPALQGACRASNPPDNSSDSDYDLNSARRV
ncbi:PREDICTED: T-cell surface glycoprotein CD5, partial [Tauraco erythrolophus]|uniref:T-cell surface glycoprotein CD5 n=1 Tax=Tauraco erythrolophus TaxID=121530 RepID=UPI0005234F12